MEQPARTSKPTRRLWPRSPWSAAGLVVAILLVLLGLAAITLRYVATTDFGRGVITSLIDGRKAGPLGTIRITGLSGDPLASATADNLAFIDENGAWMRASNIELRWSPFDILSRRLDIDLLHIESAHVFRRPQVAPSEPSSGGLPDFALRIGDASIDQIHIDDGVYGARASYRLELSGDIARNRAGDLKLDLTPLNGMGDHIAAAADWTARSLTHANISAEGLAGGTLAALIQSPAGEPVNLTLQAEGDTTDLTASAILKFGEQTIAELNAAREGQQGSAQGYVQVDGWPLLARLQQRLGQRITFTGELETSRFTRAPFAFDIQSPAGRATAAGVADLDARALRGPITLNLYDIDLARQSDTIRSGQMSGEGEARVTGLTDWSWTGPVRVSDFSAVLVSADNLEASADLSMRGDTLTWETKTAEATNFRLDSLDSFPPSNLTIASRGRYDLSDRTLTLTDSDVQGAIGASTLDGRYNIATGAMDFSGKAASTQLSSFADLTGTASGDWSVKRASSTAPYQIALDGYGEDLVSTNTSISALLGPNPTVAASATWLDGRFTLEDAKIDSETVSLDIDGQTNASGALSGTIDGSVIAPLTLPGVRIDTLRINGRLSGTASQPTALLDLTDGDLTASGVRLSELTGRTIITNDGALNIDATLTGAADGQPLEARFDLARTGDAITLSDLRVSAGELILSAPALSLENGEAAGAFSLNGTLAGLAGFTTGEIAAQGRLDSQDGAPLISITGEAANLRRPAIDLRRATFDARLQADTVSLTTELESRESTGPRLALNINGQRTDGAWSGTAALEGEGGAQPIAMTQPATWNYGPDGYALNGRANAFAGAIIADIVSGPQARSINLELADIDLRSLTRLIQLSPVVGTATGSVTLDAPYDAPRTGQFDLQLNGVNPLGADIEPINVRLAGDLQNNALSLTATGSGGAFSIDGAAQLQTTGDGLSIAPDRAGDVSATLDLTGRAEQFWAIARQPDQALSGELRLRFTAEGPLEGPSFEGGFSLADGAYDHGESGFHLESINLDGEFDRRSARLTSVSATDGRGGELKADGRLDWSGDLSGGVDFEATALNALNRDDRSATLSGTGAVTIQPEAIVISGDMTIATARFSVEQPASAKIPTLGAVRRINFPGREDTQATEGATRPIRLDLKVDAPRRVFVYGRGLDMEWATDFDVSGSTANPIVDGRATLIRGDLNLAGRRFPFDGGSISLDGPIRSARIDITATGRAASTDARVRLTGTPIDPQFRLESTPTLPQDEILARLIFGRSASELSALETAQLAAALAQLAGGQAAFDPAAVLRDATGLDRVSIGAEGDAASIAAGKYVAEDVFLQLGAGGEGGAAAEVEWEPADNLSIISSAQGNGDTRMTVRWKKDY